MPSTGWNVFIASVVALVVYIAVRAEMVLLGLIAGTLTFVVGWLLGYAINENLLDSMELSRIVGAGGVTVFAIVWTLLYSQQEYILGLIVVCLAWFAAWFTSSMGPIKGDTGAMATIDEPRPPAGSGPGEPLDLGGSDEPAADSDGGGFLSSLFGFGADDAREPRGYAADEPASATGVESETAEERSEPDRATTDTGSSAESIFGLGIFYEGEPGEPSAGASSDDQAATGADGTEPAAPSTGGTAPANDGLSDPPDPGTEPAAADHTRPSATGPAAPATGDDGATDSAPEQSPIDEAALDPPAEGASDDRRDGEATDRSRDQGGSENASEAYNTYHGDGHAERSAVSEGSEEADEEDDEPPDDHRVDVDDDDGFIFG